MSRMFCTLKEAAETLHASEDQIQMLLEKGILHEFREGPHRLLKEADVGVLASVGERRATREQAAGRGDACVARTVGGQDSPAPRPARPVPGRSSGAPRRRGSAPAKAPAPPAFPSPPSLSVRQWFWMGLVQDRPMVIALFASLVLLGLSALAAGLYFVAAAF